MNPLSISLWILPAATGAFVPEEMVQAKLRHPGVEFAMGKHLGVHKKLAEIVTERIGAGLAEAGWR